LLLLRLSVEADLDFCCLDFLPLLFDMLLDEDFEEEDSDNGRERLDLEDPLNFLGPAESSDSLNFCMPARSCW
jgi:hypothetical protein